MEDRVAARPSHQSSQPLIWSWTLKTANARTMATMRTAANVPRRSTVLVHSLQRAPCLDKNHSGWRRLFAEICHTSISSSLAAMQTRSLALRACRAACRQLWLLDATRRARSRKAAANLRPLPRMHPYRGGASCYSARAPMRERSRSNLRNHHVVCPLGSVKSFKSADKQTKLTKGAGSGSSWLPRRARSDDGISPEDGAFGLPSDPRPRL